MAKNVKVVVVGSYKDPKTKNYVPIGKEISVAEKLAIKGITARVFADPKSELARKAVSPSDTIAALEAEIKQLKTDLGVAKAYQDRVEGILQDAEITVDDLAKTLKPEG